MKDVHLTLSNDEAIVLFEFLTRFSNSDVLSIEDQAEERILWDLTCMLEKSLDEPFSADWLQHLALARARVRDSAD